jgi:hypothetical protein
MTSYARIVVGQTQGDIVGSDQRALQAAVDYVAGLGKGVVEIGPGIYTMRDSLHLRSGVHVRGAGEATVLLKCDGYSSALVLDGDYGEEQITVADGAGFDVGRGVMVVDEKAGGFHVTVNRITARDGDTMVLGGPLLADYMVAQQAVAHLQFPVLSGYYVHDSVVENLAIDGNISHNVPITGCRGAGIFLYRAHGTQVQGCVVRDYNGDGISFQQSNDVLVENCLCEGNAQLGLHPGSGSQRPIIRRCTSRKNGQIGLFLCWRVRHGVFEENVLEDNGFVGISIGHKDTDNLFRGNVVARNAVWGVLWRNESEPMAGHRNRFIDNRIIDNGQPGRGGGIRVDGETHDLVFERNFVGSTQQPARQRVGISAGLGARYIALQENAFRGNLEREREHDGDGSVWIDEADRADVCHSKD